MAEIRINATGGVKLYDADDSHYAQIVAGTITSNVDAITLGHDTVTIADNLSLGSDSAVLKFGADGDTTLTHTDGTGLTLNSTNKLTFGDVASYINQSSDGVLTIAGEATIDLTASTAVTVSNDLKLDSDAAVLSFGADTEIALTHVADTGLKLTDSGGTPTLQLHDSNESIASDGSKVIITSGGTAFSLPTSDGSNGQALITNGSAVLSFGSAGASTIGALTDVTLDATNFTNSFLLQLNSDGSAPGTGTLSTANNNIGIGKNVFAALTSGQQNTCIGETGNTLTSGSNNTLVGHGAGNSITTGSMNMGFGKGAIDGFDTESNNIGIGENALGGPVAGGEKNVAIGGTALDAVTSGDDNTALGYNTGADLTTGSNNVFIGRDAGKTTTTGSQNIFIGIDLNGLSGGAGTQEIVIGDSFQPGANNRFSFGKASNVVYNNFDSDNSWTRSSDERIKRNIQNDTLGLNFINDLRTVTFQWKDSRDVPKELTQSYNAENKMNMDITMHGMIAQEVKAALDTAGVSTFGGWHEQSDGTQSVSREMFVIPLIRAVQELTARVKELEDK
jgi:hypothetical protein